MGLYRLQQVDRQIDRAQSQLDAIRKTLENDAELRAALAGIDAAQAEQQHAKHVLQLAEAEAQAQQIKIEQAESRLYGGQVHNPKELQDLQNDVASLKRHLAALEERELEAMSKAESVESQLEHAKVELENLQSRLGNQHQQLLSEQSVLTKDLERLREEREATANPVDHSILEQYESLRAKRRGIAVTEVNDNACSACGTTLTAAIQQNARSTARLVNCPSCGRILYAA